MITARNERHHPHITHQAAGNRKESREVGLREIPDVLVHPFGQVSPDGRLQWLRGVHGAHAGRTQTLNVRSGVLFVEFLAFLGPAALSGQPLVLMFAAYASSSSTSTGALGWMLRGTHGLCKSTLFGVFSVHATSGSRTCQRPVLFQKGATNPISEPRGKFPQGSRIRKVRIQEGVKSKVCTHTTTRVARGSCTFGILPARWFGPLVWLSWCARRGVKGGVRSLPTKDISLHDRKPSRDLGSHLVLWRVDFGSSEFFGFQTTRPSHQKPPKMMLGGARFTLPIEDTSRYRWRMLRLHLRRNLDMRVKSEQLDLGS